MHFCPDQGRTSSPLGAILQTYRAIGLQMEVCTQSRRGDRFIPYFCHYNMAFAFSTTTVGLTTATVWLDRPDVALALPRSAQVTELGISCLLAGDAMELNPLNADAGAIF